MAKDSPTLPQVTSALPPGDSPDHLEEMTVDEAALAALGYKQEFKVSERLCLRAPSAQPRRLTMLSKARVLGMDDICRQLRRHGPAAQRGHDHVLRDWVWYERVTLPLILGPLRGTADQGI